MKSKHPYTDAERALVHEAQDFLRGKIRELEAIVIASADVRARLEATAAHEAVDGLDEAEEDPIWDLAATLDICVERYIVEGLELLGGCVEEPGVRLEELEDDE